MITLDINKIRSERPDLTQEQDIENLFHKISDDLYKERFFVNQKIRYLQNNVEVIKTMEEQGASNNHRLKIDALLNELISYAAYLNKQIHFMEKTVIKMV